MRCAAPGDSRARHTSSRMRSAAGFKRKEASGPDLSEKPRGERWQITEAIPQGRQGDPAWLQAIVERGRESRHRERWAKAQCSMCIGSVVLPACLRARPKAVPGRAAQGGEISSNHDGAWILRPGKNRFEALRHRRLHPPPRSGRGIRIADPGARSGSP